MEHPIKVVACLLAWDSSSVCGSNGKDIPGSIPSEDGNLNLNFIRLSGTSLEDNENGGYDEILDFHESYGNEMKNTCKALIAGKASAPKVGDNRNIYHHALQLNTALDVALNLSLWK